VKHGFRYELWGWVKLAICSKNTFKLENWAHCAWNFEVVDREQGSQREGVPRYELWALYRNWEMQMRGTTREVLVPKMRELLIKGRASAFYMYDRHTGEEIDFT